MATIKEALAQLKADNADLWTADGLPRTDIISAMVGKTVSRQEITEAAPAFTRANPVVDGVATQQPALQQPQEGAGGEDDKSDGVEGDNGERPTLEPEVTQDTARANAIAKIAEIDDELAQMERAQQQLSRARDRALKDRDLAQALLQKLDPAEHPSQTIQNYLQRQKENRAAAVAGVQRLREQGLTPAVFKVSAPIDEALRNKRK